MTNGSNDWDVAYSGIRFMEDALTGHSRVDSFDRRNEILFEITRTGNLRDVTMVLVDRYTIGLADVLKAKQEFPSMDCIVTLGNWSSWTNEAKEHGLRSRIGVFNTGQFLGALHRKEIHTYVPPDQREGKNQKRRRSS